jgi:hypothetical protein
MRTLVASAIFTIAFSVAARAQTDGVERLSVFVEAAALSSPGGEGQRVAGGANAAEPGKMAWHGFSLEPDRCVWGVSRVVQPDADLGWAVEITPVRVVKDAVTFRLVWARTRHEGKASTQPKGDVELTLRAGESIPLDVVHRPCPSQPRMVGASLRVAVLRYPDPDYDRRLVALDLWLFEKLPDGTERSQPLVLRGLYHQPIAFYFDSLSDGATKLDIFGDVIASPGDRASDVKITTRSRVIDPAQPPGRPFPRETTATIAVAPNEVVSVQLPQVADSAAFASRALSLRIRLRQVR